MRSVARAAGRGALIAGAVAMVSLAGCSAAHGTGPAGGASGSTRASGSTGGSGSGAAAAAVSGLVPTGQLSAVGISSGPGAGIVASAGQSSPQSAPWYAPGDSPAITVYTSQDFRTAVAIWGGGTAEPTAMALEPDGTDTTLYDLSNSEDGAFISADGQWAVFVPGASVEDPVTQVYRLSGATATPVTFSVPSQVTQEATASSEPVVIGFTTSDQVLVASAGALWEVSPDGRTAQQLAASTANSDNFSGGVVDEVTGTPQAGLIAMDDQTFNSDQVASNSTVLLSPSGDVLHTFSGGSPGSFGPDGKYLLINTTPSSGDGDSSSQEACNVVTYACLPTPSGGAGSWLPNGDLVATVGSDPRGWWNPATRAGEGVPPVFQQFQSLNHVLPTALMTRLAAVKQPTTYASGGD